MNDTKVPDFLYTRFDDRQMKQIEFSQIYAKQFHHGADGHNNMMIIGKLIDVIKELVNPQIEIRSMP